MLPLCSNPAAELRLQPPIEAAPELPLVLVVDDNERNCEMVVDYLEAKGFRAVALNGGAAVVEQTCQRRPALILMDIQMPEVDGLEAIRRVRKLPAISATPIIAVTGLVMPGDRERCLAAGANAYLVKPVRLRELVASIDELLGRPSRQQAAPQL